MLCYPKWFIQMVSYVYLSKFYKASDNRSAEMNVIITNVSKSTQTVYAVLQGKRWNRHAYLKDGENLINSPFIVLYCTWTKGLSTTNSSIMGVFLLNSQWGLLVLKNNLILFYQSNYTKYFLFQLWKGLIPMIIAGKKLCRSKINIPPFFVLAQTARQPKKHFLTTRDRSKC